MENPAGEFCVRCERSGELRRLERCTICHRTFCLDCEVRGHGNKGFCSQGCAEVFFFGTDDPDDPRYDDENADWDD